MHGWLVDARLASWWLTWDDLKWPDAELEREWTDRAGAFAQYIKPLRTGSVFENRVT